MKKIVLSILLLALGHILSAQSTFHKSFSIPGKSGLLYRCGQTTDGGFVSAGKVSDFTTFDDDFLIIKTDATGNAGWIKKLSTPDSEEFTDFVETADGGLVAVGSSFNMTTFLSQAVVVRFNASGTRLWTKAYSSASGSVNVKRIQQDATGNLYVLGTIEGAATSSDYLILTLDATGNFVSKSIFSTPDMDYPLSFLRSSSGEFFIDGWDNTFSGENIHLIKLNANMTVAWSKRISGTTKYFAYDMQELPDGKIILAGRYDEGTPAYDILLACFDPSTGNQVWAKSYSSSEGFGTYAYGVTIQNINEIVITGLVENTDKGTLLMAASQDGNLVWSHKSGAPGSTGLGYGVGKNTDGGFIICGNFEGGNDEIVQLIRTGSNGEVPCYSDNFDLTDNSVTLPVQDVSLTSQTGTIVVQDIVLNEESFNTLGNVCLGAGTGEMNSERYMISPNPSTGVFTVTMPDKVQINDISVYDFTGGEVYHAGKFDGLSTNQLKLNLNLSDGTYFLVIRNQEDLLKFKVIIKNNNPD